MTSRPVGQEGHCFLAAAISYRNHQKSLACFSHLEPLTLFFFTKRQSEKGGRAWHNAPSLNTLLISLFESSCISGGSAPYLEAGNLLTAARATDAM